MSNHDDLAPDRKGHQVTTRVDKFAKQLGIKSGEVMQFFRDAQEAEQEDARQEKSKIDVEEKRVLADLLDRSIRSALRPDNQHGTERLRAAFESITRDVAILAARSEVESDPGAIGPSDLIAVATRIANIVTRLAHADRERPLRDMLALPTDEIAPRLGSLEDHEKQWLAARLEQDKLVELLADRAFAECVRPHLPRHIVDIIDVERIELPTLVRVSAPLGWNNMQLSLRPEQLAELQRLRLAPASFDVYESLAPVMPDHYAASAKKAKTGGFYTGLPLTDRVYLAEVERRNGVGFDGPKLPGMTCVVTAEQLACIRTIDAYLDAAIHSGTVRADQMTEDEVRAHLLELWSREIKLERRRFAETLTSETPARRRTGTKARKRNS